MGIQTSLGKAFEYACLQSLYNNVSGDQQIVIEQTSAYSVAKDFYENAVDSMKQKMDLGAAAGVKAILRLEPQLQNQMKNVPLYLAIQEDSKGKTGDVRDVICIRKQNEWEIGLSCKHNHSAVKHNRLSPTIDFGDEWLNLPCSPNYFNTINPLFDELREMKSNHINWRDIKSKEQRFYIPVLQAFMTELKSLDYSNPGLVPQRLLQYLLGRNDFYKIITLDRKKLTKVQAFNIYGSLNRPAGSARPQTRIQQLNMPTKFYDINFKQNSTTTVNVTCDGGWAVSMRIHNASTEVETSLKFDVSLIGIPPTLYTHFEPWS